MPKIVEEMDCWNAGKAQTLLGMTLYDASNSARTDSKASRDSLREAAWHAKILAKSVPGKTRKLSIRVAKEAAKLAKDKTLDAKKIEELRGMNLKLRSASSSACNAKFIY